MDETGFLMHEMALIHLGYGILTIGFYYTWAIVFYRIFSRENLASFLHGTNLTTWISFSV